MSMKGLLEVSVTWKTEVGGSVESRSSRPACVLVRPYLNNNNNKVIGLECTSVVKYALCKCEALDSIPRILYSPKSNSV
jgi:hypothetical protein